MSPNTTEYTIERYKIDLRRKDGLRLLDKIDYIPSSIESMESAIRNMEDDGFIINYFPTYTTQKNLITGELYQERYDTPSFCSPSSESFWSM
ncbi:MAG: hypothetical protein ACO294_12585 [Methylococcales bacterium]